MDQRQMNRRRNGFTLIETVVTIGLISVLASFVIPTVMRKADSADPVKVANDLTSIGLAMEAFATDVKGSLPGELEELTQPLQVNSACNQLNPCDSTLLHNAIYTIQQASQWKGPYLDASITRSPLDTLRTGYTAQINNVLTRFDAISGVPELCPLVGGVSATCAGFVSTNPLFIAVRVLGLTKDQALQVNQILDGPNEVNPGLEGRFRFYPDSGSPAYFLAVPGPALAVPAV